MPNFPVIPARMADDVIQKIQDAPTTEDSEVRQG